MRVIFLNRYFYPDHSATSQMLSELAFALAAQGYDIHVITSRQRYDDPKSRLSPFEHVGQVAIYRVWTSRWGRGKLLGRALDYLTFYVSAAWRLWRLARRGDIIVAKTDPPLLSVVAGPICRLRGARLINWLQDVFPEVAAELGVGRGAARPLFRLLRLLRNRSLRLAAANVVLGERMQRHLRQEAAPNSIIHIIPNWANGAAVQPVAAAKNKLRQAWGLDGKFVIGYSGNLGRAHDLDTILAAIALLNGQGPLVNLPGDTARAIVFLFIGGGALYPRLKEEAVKRRLTNVQLRPYQPRERLAESLSAADVHLISLRPELEGLIVPSKFYGITAAGRPALHIGDPDGEIPQLLREASCGFTVRTGDGESLARHILALAGDPERCQAMGARARALFEQRFEKDIGVAAWAALFNGLDERYPYKRPLADITSRGDQSRA